MTYYKCESGRLMERTTQKEYIVYISTAYLTPKTYIYILSHHFDYKSAGSQKRERYDLYSNEHNAWV